MNNKILIGIIIAVLALGAAFFMMKQNSSNPSSDNFAVVDQTPAASPAEDVTPQPSVATDSATESSTADNVKEFTVSGSNFKFEPSTLSVSKGDKVRVVFINTSGFHDFALDEFNVKTKQIQGGATETVEFTADKVGSFEYYCSVGKHREMGMKGTLTVK